MSVDRVTLVRLTGAVAVLIALGILYAVLNQIGALAVVTDTAKLREFVHQLGWLGPLSIIVMMIMAIVLSPIPSGPIAMVAGAVYGANWGTTYVVIGAEAGAIIAFCLSRVFGYQLVRRLSGARPLMAWLGRERSQTGLMLIVFASRLMPFISFDAVSYAAGLTPLAGWRFLLATVAGVIPTAYLITRFGEFLISTESGGITILILLISGVTLLPVVAHLIRSLLRQKRDSKHR